MKLIRNLTKLSDYLMIASLSADNIHRIVKKFSFSVTEHVLSLMDREDKDDPIAKQFLPTENELTVLNSEKKDPIGDFFHTKVKGIIHRYPDRVLLTPVHVCPVYCRFCFRREKVGDASETMSPDELDIAINYIQSNDGIWEVILTGGDPLILKPSMLGFIIRKLAAISHVEVIRIHTRVPVVSPDKINDVLLEALKITKPVYVVLHANHPKEFNEKSIEACAKIIDKGLPMLSQTVLLKDINDDIETLSALMRCFVKHRIKPYYLHQGDLAEGTSHFRTTIDKGQTLMKQLRGRYSGLCQPTYILDIPGGHGKIPIGPNYCLSENHELYTFVDYMGESHDYLK